MEHFFEKLEREIDFQKEYEKLEKMVMYGRDYSIDSCFAYHFLEWKNRKNFTSMEELRSHLGFEAEFSSSDNEYSFPQDVNMKRYFLYCEMLLNLAHGLWGNFCFHPYQEPWTHVCETMKYNIERMGFEIRTAGSNVMIVEKNAVAIEAADKVPKLADKIVEYNHYLLRGDLERKRIILKGIADAIEPKRKELERIDKTKTSDFFFVVNRMNIRHNNSDPADKSHYCKQFAELDSKEKEEWYDLIYQQGLMLFVLLDQQERSEKIREFKSAIEC